MKDSERKKQKTNPKKKQLLKKQNANPIKMKQKAKEKKVEPQLTTVGLDEGRLAHDIHESGGLLATYLETQLFRMRISDPVRITESA